MWGRSRLGRGRLFDGRQREPERAALPCLAGDTDLAAVGLDDLLGDEEAQPGAGRAAAGHAEELLEDGVLELLGDAGAGVADLEDDVAVVAAGAHHHLAAGRGVADRVADQVGAAPAASARDRRRPRPGRGGSRD